LQKLLQKVYWHVFYGTQRITFFDMLNRILYLFQRIF